jgi:hypothetical protein
LIFIVVWKWAAANPQQSIPAVKAVHIDG